jgi:hypothetical protein
MPEPDMILPTSWRLSHPEYDGSCSKGNRSNAKTSDTGSEYFGDPSQPNPKLWHILDSGLSNRGPYGSEAIPLLFIILYPRLGATCVNSHFRSTVSIRAKWPSFFGLGSFNSARGPNVNERRPFLVPQGGRLDHLRLQSDARQPRRIVHNAGDGRTPPPVAPGLPTSCRWCPARPVLPPGAHGRAHMPNLPWQVRFARPLPITADNVATPSRSKPHRIGRNRSQNSQNARCIPTESRRLRVSSCKSMRMILNCLPNHYGITDF